MAKYKKWEHQKRNNETDKKHYSEIDNDEISYEDLQKVFLMEPKQKDKNKKDLMAAFSLLTPDQNEEMISIKRLEDMLLLYDKEYSSTVTLFYKHKD